MNLDGTATEDQIKESLQTIAQRNFDINLAKAKQRGRGPMGERGPGGGRRRDYTASVNLQSAEGVRKTVNERADGIIWTLSLLPLITLAVASLGVVNTVLSSIRARRWDMGVLRAVGVTRFGLVRMILAEAILVGIVACLLSLGFGVMAGYEPSFRKEWYYEYYEWPNPEGVRPTSRHPHGAVQADSLRDDARGVRTLRPGQRSRRDQEPLRRRASCRRAEGTVGAAERSAEAGAATGQDRAGKIVIAIVRPMAWRRDCRGRRAAVSRCELDSWRAQIPRATAGEKGVLGLTKTAPFLYEKRQKAG